MTPPRQPSSPDDDPPGRGNGNAKSGDDELGEELERCKLGDDCPYAGSMRWLFDERLQREQVEGELAATVDRLGDHVQRVSLALEALKGSLYELENMVKGKTAELERTLSLRVIEVDAALKAHTRSHRWIELLVMGLAMGFGSAVTRWIGGK